MILRRLLLVLPCSVFLAGLSRADSVPVGESSLIGTLDLSDAFTLGTGTRADLAAGAFPVGTSVPDALGVESTYGNGDRFWSDSRWSLDTDASVNNGTPPYPGGSGGGSATGMTQTGNAVDYGVEYDLREDYVVQFDAVQPLDRVNITTGNARDSIAGALNPNGLSVFIRADGSALPEVGLYNEILGEVNTGLDTGAVSLKTGQWHNYAVRFNLPAKALTVFVDEVNLGTVDLTTLSSDTVAAGAFAELLSEFTNDAVSVGGSGGTRFWSDNFQAGSFGMAATPGIRLGSPVTVRDTKNTPSPADDTWTVRVRITGRGPVSAAGWKVTPPAGAAGAATGAYGTVAEFSGIPVSVPEVSLTFTDAASAVLNALVTVPVPPVPEGTVRGVVVGASTLLSETDYADTFTIGEGASGTRLDTPYATGAYPIPDGSPLLAVESAFGNPARSWTTGVWSLNNNAIIADGTPVWPGDSGAGSASGITQTGNGIDFGIEYGLRTDFVVQVDAVQTPDRIDLTAGNVRDSIAGGSLPNGLSVFIRADGSSLPEVGIYNSVVGEIDAGMDTGRAGVTVGSWHNYAARFNLPDRTLTVFVDQVPLGTLDLAAFHDGAFAALISADSNKAVSVGAAGGNRVWTDNFQLGAPMGVPVGHSTLIAQPDYSDTFTIGAGNVDNVRNEVPYVIGAFPITDEAQLAVENHYNNPPQAWITGRWSLNNDSVIADGEPAWPGGIGGGSHSGITQTGNAVDYGIGYDLREDFVVQFDAVQTADRIDITAGNVPNDIASGASPNGLSVFFRVDGHTTLPEVGIYNQALGEVSANLDTGLAKLTLGKWHNYAVRFNLPAKALEIFVDEIKLGTVDLTTFGGPTAQNNGTVEPGAFAALISEFTNDAVSVGGSGGNRIWTDNFQVGAPDGAPPLTTDSDGDGMSDAAELIAGTDPHNATSVLRIASFTPKTDGSGGYEVRFPSVTGRFYKLYTSTDLKTWARVDALGTITGTGSEAVATISAGVVAGAPKRFFQIQAATTDDFAATVP